MLMLSDVDKEACGSDAGGVDKLLFSQGIAQTTQTCSATLMQSSETLVAFGVLSPSKHTHGGFNKLSV